MQAGRLEILGVLVPVAGSRLSMCDMGGGGCSLLHGTYLLLGW